MSVICDVLVEDARWARISAERLVERAVATALSESGQTVSDEAEVSFLFSTDAHVRDLNAQWRKKDVATNVLSFPAADPEDLPQAFLLGDVILAYETIDKEARDEGKSFDHHVAHLIVHGFLHLIGYDHQDEGEAFHMESLESKILLRLGVPDPWADR